MRLATDEHGFAQMKYRYKKMQSDDCRLQNHEYKTNERSSGVVRGRWLVTDLQSVSNLMLTSIGRITKKKRTARDAGGSLINYSTINHST